VLKRPATINQMATRAAGPITIARRTPSGISCRRTATNVPKRSERKTPMSMRSDPTNPMTRIVRCHACCCSGVAFQSGRSMRPRAWRTTVPASIRSATAVNIRRIAPEPCLGGNAASRRSDARIHHDQKDRSRRKIAIRRGELERAGQHVMRRHIVRDVNQRDVRTDPQDHTLERAGVVIAQAKIREQGDDWARHGLIVLQNCRNPAGRSQGDLRVHQESGPAEVMGLNRKPLEASRIR